MDRFTLETLSHNIPKRVVMSYDIGCQWGPGFEDRCHQYPSNVVSENEIEMVFLVPKFHLAAHILKCQETFAFGRCVGVGRTDGEAPERSWALINSMASSTREMGPGSRRDTIDDAFGDTNWRKAIGMGTFSAHCVHCVYR
jgi:hypothetical protein